MGMVPQTTSETVSSSDKEHDVLLWRFVFPIEFVWNTRDSEGVRFRREVAYSWKNDICVLTRLPLESTS